MGEPPPPTSSLAQSTAEARTRSGSQIPRAWTLPAETFSQVETHTGLGVWVGGGLAAAAAVALVVVVSALSPRSTTPAPRAVAPTINAPTTASTTNATTTASTTNATTTTEPPTTEPHTEPTTTPTSTTNVPPTTTAAPTTTATTTMPEPADVVADQLPATRLRARALIGRARRAARDGDRDKALVLAEQAVASDDGCGGCWRTLALLRRQKGDRPGAAQARARAEAAVDPLP